MVVINPDSSKTGWNETVLTIVRAVYWIFQTNFLNRSRGVHNYKVFITYTVFLLMYCTSCNLNIFKNTITMKWPMKILEGNIIIKEIFTDHFFTI